MQEFFDKAGIVPVNKASKNYSKISQKNLVKIILIFTRKRLQ